MGHFVFANPTLCIGCDTCLAACAEAHMAAGAVPQPRLSIIRSVKASTPVTCHQCENAPCVAVCPVNALIMNDNGIALNESLCTACGLCVPACPFGVMKLAAGGAPHDNEGGRGAGDATSVPQKQMAAMVAAKCDCDIAKNGAECVRACPTDALVIVDTKFLRRSGKAKRKAATLSMPVSFNFFTDKKA